MFVDSITIYNVFTILVKFDHKLADSFTELLSSIYEFFRLLFEYLAIQFFISIRLITLKLLAIRFSCFFFMVIMIRIRKLFYGLQKFYSVQDCIYFAFYQSAK